MKTLMKSWMGLAATAAAVVISVRDAESRDGPTSSRRAITAAVHITGSAAGAPEPLCDAAAEATCARRDSL